MHALTIKGLRYCWNFKFVSLFVFKLLRKKLNKVLKDIKFKFKFKGIVVRPSHWILCDEQEGLFLIS